SRDVRHILVASHALASRLYRKILAGADFGALARRYSIDPGTKNAGGKLHVNKGETVAAFERVAFSLRTGEVAKPVHTVYSWHIVQALSPVHAAHLKPFAAVRASILKVLRTTKRAAALSAFVSQITR